MPFPRYAPDGVSWTLARNRPPANKKAGQCPAFSIPHKLSSADALQHRGDALTHADAHRREAELGVLVVQYMRQCAGNARTRTAERMAERDRTTADVAAVHALRSEERRVGKRCVRKCRSGGSPETKKTK